jgi:hypothetical protein
MRCAYRYPFLLLLTHLICDWFAWLPAACLLPQHHPIFLERLGQLDGRRMQREGASDDVILAYHLREMEFMSQVSGSA